MELRLALFPPAPQRGMMPVRPEASLLLGGPQGAGLETAAQVLTSAFAHTGRRVYSYREYYSNIKGRHTYIILRVSSRRQPRAPRETPDIMAFIDAESIFHHYREAGPGTLIVYDINVSEVDVRRVPSIEPETLQRILRHLAPRGTRVVDALSAAEGAGARLLGLDYKIILKWFASDHGYSIHRARRYVNTIPLAAVAYVLGLEPDDLEAGFRRRFKSRERLVRDNLELARLVYRIVEEAGLERNPLEPSRNPPNEFFVVSGNDAVAMGKVAGGLRVQTYYPITPAADESIALEAHEILETSKGSVGEVLVFQTEDEIAAISAAIGAALTGARSATSTSGPGFDLMIEALGWAGINEVPIVVTYYQRGGPSTGLPTRGGQEDLFNAIFSGHGLFPKIVLASGDHEEAFRDAVWSLNLAERYQIPVIHLLDKFLANSIVTMEPPRLDGLIIDRGLLIEKGGPGYNRFDKSSGPLSPRAPVGAPETVQWMTGDEHGPEGHISEDPENRINMHNARMRKLELADREIPEEDRLSLYRHGGEFLLVGWGSVKGPALEVAKQRSGAYLHVRMMSPFPKRLVREVIGGFPRDRVILVEHSVRPLLGRLIAMETGIEIAKHVLKWTGRPIYPGELTRAVERLLSRASGVEVLRHGA